MEFGPQNHNRDGHLVFTSMMVYLVYMVALEFYREGSARVHARIGRVASSYKPQTLHCILARKNLLILRPEEPNKEPYKESHVYC